MNTEEAKAFVEKLVLAHGKHSSPEEGMCVMEVVSVVAGEPFTDFPKCASRVVTKFAMTLNDRWGDERRQKLKPFVLRIAGTAAPDLEKKRAFMCADWAVRELLPIAMDAAKLPEWSEKLRALPEIIDRDTANNGAKVAREARAEADKKYYAAYAAYAAAADAADAAAYAADAAAYAAADAADAYADAAAAAAAAAYAADAADAAAAAYAADAYAARAKADASALAFLDRLIKVTETN